MTASNVPQEHQFLATPTAMVSNARAIINGVTYPVSAISSVRLATIPPSPWGWVVGILGLFFIAGKMWTLVAFFLIVGILLILVFPRQFVVMLTTAGGERAAMKSRERNVINGIVLAINEAIVSRALGTTHSDTHLPTYDAPRT